METIPITYWIPKIHKNPVRWRFITEPIKFTLKPLSKGINAIFNLLYIKKWKALFKRHWSGLKKFWVNKVNKPVID